MLFRSERKLKAGKSIRKLPFVASRVITLWKGKHCALYFCANSTGCGRPNMDLLAYLESHIFPWKDYAAAFVSQSHSFPHCHKCGNNSGALFFSSGLLATGKISSDANEGKPLPNHRNAAIHRLRVNPRPFIFDEKRDRKFALQSLL